MKEDTCKEGAKKKVQGCLVNIFSQCLPLLCITEVQLHSHKTLLLHHGGRGCNAPYLCVLITKLASSLTDCLTGRLNSGMNV